MDHDMCRAKTFQVVNDQVTIIQFGQHSTSGLQLDCKASRMIKPVAGSEAEAGAGGWLSDWTGLAFLNCSDLWHHHVCNSTSHLDASSISPDWFLNQIMRKTQGVDEKGCGWICYTYHE